MRTWHLFGVYGEGCQSRSTVLIVECMYGLSGITVSIPSWTELGESSTSEPYFNHHHLTGLFWVEHSTILVLKALSPTYDKMNGMRVTEISENLVRFDPASLRKRKADGQLFASHSESEN